MQSYVLVLQSFVLVQDLKTQAKKPAYVTGSKRY